MCDICVDLSNNFEQAYNGKNAQKQTAIINTPNVTLGSATANNNIFTIFNGQVASASANTLNVTYPISMTCLAPYNGDTLIYSQIEGLNFITIGNQPYIQLPKGEYRIRYSLTFLPLNNNNGSINFNIYDSNNNILSPATLNPNNIPNLTTTMNLVDDSGNVLTTSPTIYNNYVSLIYLNNLQQYVYLRIQPQYFDFYINLEKTTNLTVKFVLAGITSIITNVTSFPSQPIYSTWFMNQGSEIMIQKL